MPMKLITLLTRKRSAARPGRFCKSAMPKMLLARTRHEDTDYEDISIVDIPRWLLGSIFGKRKGY